ncbi:hypothetical protein FDECE_7785, partial [Fusarium decemcellulare]
MSDERRRARYIRQALTGKLQQAGHWPRTLPTELWLSVASFLLEDCAALTAQEQAHGSNSAEESILKLTEPIHVSYVKIDGRSYVKNLRNTVGTNTKGGGHIILPAPIEQKRGKKENDEGKDMFWAADHLGIRKVFFVSPRHCDAWCRTHPSAPGAWWKHVSGNGIPSTVVIKSDGLKIRDIEGPRKEFSTFAPRISWQVPVSTPPTVLDL